jgi:hypothetical protein
MYMKFGLPKGRTHLRVLENKVQRKTFGPKMQESSRRAESENLHDLSVH